MVISCTKPEMTLTVNPQTIDAGRSAGSKLVNVTAGGSWKVETSASWLSASRPGADGTAVVKISWTANEAETRMGKVLFTWKGGSTELTVTQKGAFVPESYVPDLSGMAAPLSASMIFSKGVMLYKQKNIMQGFDFTDASHFYYSQGPSSDKYQYLSFCPGPSVGYTSYMTLERFGHMTQIVAEAAEDGNTYIWCNSNGQSGSDGYGENLSFSRIQYKPGTTLKGGYAGDTFVLSKTGHMDLQVSVDFDYRRLLVGTRVSGKAFRYFWVYDLDQALNLPLKDVTLSVRMGTASNITNDDATTASRTFKARDLADLTPLGYFEIPRGSVEAGQTYSYSHQGHEVHGDYVWFYEGNAVADGSNYKSYAYVTVYDYQGKVVVKRTALKAIEDNNAMSSFGLTKVGYAEGESMKVKDGKLYLGLACHDGSGTYRYSDILVFNIK